MKRFASPGQTQRFLSAFSGITGHFQLRRHMLSASDWRREMTDRFAVWNEITAPTTAACITLPANNVRAETNPNRLHRCDYRSS